MKGKLDDVPLVITRRELQVVYELVRGLILGKSLEVRF